MKKFILISFGFLGWAFYEMSGGDEFEPASERLARLAPETETSEVQTETPSQRNAFVDTDPPLIPLSPEVTRVSLNLTTLEDVLERTNPDEESAAEETTTTTEDDTGVPRNVALVTESGTTPAIIPSLITGNTPIVATEAAGTEPTQGLDLRTVSGNRVNVRGGPGTDYGIVNRLVRGDEVEVLEENGDGWVRMRTVDTGEEGWMADFLLTSG